MVIYTYQYKEPFMMIVNRAKSGYQLFEYDCKKHIEYMTQRHLMSITIEYIASHIWPYLSNNLHVNYQNESIVQNSKFPPNLISLKEFIFFIEKTRVFDVIHMEE